MAAAAIAVLVSLESNFANVRNAAKDWVAKEQTRRNVSAMSEASEYYSQAGQVLSAYRASHNLQSGIEQLGKHLDKAEFLCRFQE